MRESLIDLIERMARVEPCVNSEQSVSWRAHREAEQLDDLSLLAELEAYLAEKVTKEKRTAAYFIIGSIGKNSQTIDCTLLLLAYASGEKDKYALSSLLDRLSDLPKPAELDLAPLLILLEDQRWLVRHAAIRALAHSSSSEVEDRLIALLEASTDPYDTVYSQATLGQVGTFRALPILSRNLKSRKRDVRMSAAAAIETITAREASNEVAAG